MTTEELVVLFTSLQNIVILSILVTVRVSVKAQMSYVHITEYTTFVSLQFSPKEVLWTSTFVLQTIDMWSRTSYKVTSTWYHDTW